MECGTVRLRGSYTGRVFREVNCSGAFASICPGHCATRPTPTAICNGIADPIECSGPPQVDCSGVFAGLCPGLCRSHCTSSHTAAPTDLPTASPTASPTESPTESPTTSPTVRSISASRGESSSGTATTTGDTGSSSTNPAILALSVIGLLIAVGSIVAFVRQHRKAQHMWRVITSLSNRSASSATIASADFAPQYPGPPEEHLPSAPSAIHSPGAYGNQHVVEAHSNAQNTLQNRDGDEYVALDGTSPAGTVPITAAQGGVLYSIPYEHNAVLYTSPLPEATAPGAQLIRDPSGGDSYLSVEGCAQHSHGHDGVAGATGSPA